MDNAATLTPILLSIYLNIQGCLFFDHSNIFFFRQIIVSFTISIAKIHKKQLEKVFQTEDAFQRKSSMPCSRKFVILYHRC